MIEDTRDYSVQAFMEGVANLVPAVNSNCPLAQHFLCNFYRELQTSDSKISI